MLVIGIKNPEKVEELREKYKGKCLIEIAQRGNGNSLYYVIADSPEYEEMLWKVDNEINEEGREFIGSSESMIL